jgi:hypothetical protein
LVWADFAQPPSTVAPAPARVADYQLLADGFYESARYLLRHNRKPAPAASSEPTD